MITVRDDIESIGQIAREHPNEEILIEIKNTRGQSVEELRRMARLYPQVKFSVLGGLDYHKKKKYDSSYYQERTIYSPIELSEIIKFYESIERGLGIDWNETQKAMYLYKRICDYMYYSENEVNGKDYARGIGGVLYRKAVCAGFAMIYKEALDRIGIENYYQNIRHHHSWNIAKLDGQYRGLELTWDCSCKQQEGCAFGFFGRDKDFYQHKHHIIDNEPEETRFPLATFSFKEIEQNFQTIMRPKNVEFDTEQKGEVEVSSKFKIARNGRFYKAHTEQVNGMISLITNDDKENHKCFRRKDGTSFCLIKSEDKVQGLHKFTLLEHKDGKLSGSYIFSELPLVELDSQYDLVIANGLLSSSRVKRKINQFNGYVGYFGKDRNIYFSERVEKALNIVDR